MNITPSIATRSGIIVTPLSEQAAQNTCTNGFKIQTFIEFQFTYNNVTLSFEVQISEL